MGTKVDTGWNELVGWCLEYGRDIPYMSGERDEDILNEEAYGNWIGEWTNEMRGMLEGPLLDICLEQMGLREAAIFGTTQIAGILYKKMRAHGIKVLCFIEEKPEKSRFEKLEVAALWDAGAYEGAQMVLSGVFPCEESKRLLHEAERRMSEKSGRRAAFASEILSTVYPLIKFGSQLYRWKENKALGIHMFARYALTDFANYTRREEMILNSARPQHAYKELEGYSDELAEEVFRFAEMIRTRQGIRHTDCRGRYLNIVSGKRYTEGTPAKYRTCVHLFGDCSVFGYGAEDAHTIASVMQRQLNEYRRDAYRVINHGVQGLNVLGNPSFENVRNTVIHKGDILFFLFDSSLYVKGYDPFFRAFYDYLGIGFHDRYAEWQACRLSNPEQMLYADKVHLSRHGMKLLADSFVSVVKKSKQEEEALAWQEYAGYLAEHGQAKEKQTGAVVMNGNPFTNGHLYLIEEAAKRVERLYVFVVEEDRSEFAFKDRLRLIREGTSDLENVSVLRSGAYILSNRTFPEYFTKDSPGEVSVDASEDVEFFGSCIAPLLHISVRFAGDEPFCGITRQYNEAMRELLPLYHVNYIEIKRKEEDGIPISASRIRSLLEEGRMEEIERLVPPCVYSYLLEKRNAN